MFNSVTTIPCESTTRAGNEWSAAEWCFWAEDVLCRAVGTGAKEDTGPGYGPGAFLGTGIRTTPVETYAMTMQCVLEGMVEHDVTGHTMALMTAHSYPVDAVSWMLKVLTVTTDFRRILVPAWIKRCTGAWLLFGPVAGALVMYHCLTRWQWQALTGLLNLASGSDRCVPCLCAHTHAYMCVCVQMTGPRQRVQKLAAWRYASATL
jgi:hypothetical protein